MSAKGKTKPTTISKAISQDNVSSLSDQVATWVGFIIDYLKFNLCTVAETKLN